MEKMIFSSDEIANSIKETIAAGGHFPLVVTGTSMQPFLKNGEDVVWLRACIPSDLRKGSILLFERIDSLLVLHRVCEVLSDGRLEMNGDGQIWSEKIDPDNVIAVVDSVEKNGRKTLCSSPWYRLKVAVWLWLKPVRYYIMKIYKMFRR